MAQDNASLLIEIGTEELPPKSLDELAAAFAAGIAGGLARREIGADAAAAKTYCSPRRLASSSRACSNSAMAHPGLLNISAACTAISTGT